MFFGLIMREALSIVLTHFAIVSNKLFSACRWNLAITKMPMSHHLDDGDDVVLHLDDM
jgi:hypothetical protein